MVDGAAVEPVPVSRTWLKALPCRHQQRCLHDAEPPSTGCRPARRVGVKQDIALQRRPLQPPRRCSLIVTLFAPSFCDAAKQICIHSSTRLQSNYVVVSSSSSSKGNVISHTARWKLNIIHNGPKQEAQLPLRNRASATYFFVAKLISIAHSCL